MMQTALFDEATDLSVDCGCDGWRCDSHEYHRQKATHRAEANGSDWFRCWPCAVSMARTMRAKVHAIAT